MKIEFKKVPSTEKSFNFETNSVNLEGTFCRMSAKLIKIDAKLSGNINVDCCLCGKSFDHKLNDNLIVLVSQGFYDSETEHELDIIEVDGDFLDFEEILQSEIESIKSDYLACSDCDKQEKQIDFEF